jgi:hypothetical protein
MKSGFSAYSVAKNGVRARDMVIFLFPYSSFKDAVSMSYCIELNFKRIVFLWLYSPLLDLSRFFEFLILSTQVTVAERSKGCTVFACSEAGSSKSK